MNPKYSIYIISKGRPSCITAKKLQQMRVPFKIVIEPSEENLYSSNWNKEKLLIAPENFSEQGKGSIPVRNFVFDYSINKQEKKHWILDDNIEQFYRLNRNKKLIVTDGTIFRCCEDFTDRYDNVPMSGMNYASFCKKTDKIPPYYLNTRIYSCILLDNSLEFRWRGKYNEDTDLSLRILKSGYCTILFNAFLCGKVTTQRMKGGNTNDLYEATDQRKEFAESLVEQHPDVVRVSWKFNRWHHHVNYKPFKLNNLKRKKEFDNLKSEINNYGMKEVSLEN